MKSPFFSIIIPMYNSEQFLLNLFVNLEEQNFSDLEIILVDDGSKDQTRAICKKFIDKTQLKIAYYYKENGGLSDARNFGLIKSTGKFILFLDSDDCLSDNALWHIYEIIKEKQAEVFCLNIITKTEDNNIKELYGRTTKSTLSGLEFLYEQLTKKSMRMSACRNIYLRSFLLKNNLFFVKNIIHEDEEWTPRMFLKASKIYHSNFCHYIRNITTDSLSRPNNYEKNIYSIIKICNEKIVEYQKITPRKLSKELRKYYVNLLLYYLAKDLTNLDKYTSHIDKNIIYTNSGTLTLKIKVILLFNFPNLYSTLKRKVKKWKKSLK